MSEVKTNKISSLASNNDITLDPDGTGDTIIASGNLGIGTTSPGRFVHLEDGTDTTLHLTTSSTGSTGSDGTSLFVDGTAASLWQRENDYLRFATNNTERMRIDSSGNVLVGKTSADSNSAGIELHSNDIIKITRAGTTAFFNRISSDGNILDFYQAGSRVGELVTKNGYLALGTADTGLLFEDDSNVIEPFNVSGLSARDDAIDLGAGSARFDDIRATNGTIQTSDQNDKQQIASLTTAQITAAKAISKLFKTFKWNKSVTENGDAARTHAGVIAQEVQTAMTDAGLDAADYAFWCSDTWTNDDGTSQTRLGIRYPELLAFVGAATEQRLANLETRVTALEDA